MWLENIKDWSHVPFYHHLHMFVYDIFLFMITFITGATFTDPLPRSFIILSFSVTP